MGAVLLRDNGGGSSTGTELQRLFRLDLNGRPVNGTWILRVNDTQSTDAGTLLDFQVTPHHAAGEPVPSGAMSRISRSPQ
jgi:subtilisin-like proprotein convertase family protein